MAEPFSDSGLRTALRQLSKELANKVYGGRMGNTAPNDELGLPCAGPKQITGKGNYRQSVA